MMLGIFGAAIQNMFKLIGEKRAERRAIAFREENPVRIIGIPNPDAYYQVLKTLDDFTAAANNFRPQLSGTVDNRFVTLKFPTHLFAFERPHPDTLSEIEPVKITITADELAMSGGSNIATLFSRASEP